MSDLRVFHDPMSWLNAARSEHVRMFVPARYPRRDIRVELTLVLEQLRHVRHQRHVPTVHLTHATPVGIDTEAFIHRGLERGLATVSEGGGERARHACESQHGGQNRHRGPRFPRRSPAPASASEPRGHGSRQPELASREDAFKSPASEKPAQAECWSGSLATRVRVIRRSHRAARRYEHVWRQTRRIRLRWGRHPCADKARALWNDQNIFPPRARKMRAGRAPPPEREGKGG